MADTLQLTVVTPERALVDEAVDQVQVPGMNGYLGLLPGHAALFSELKTGELSYTQGGRSVSLAISRGFVEVMADAVRVLADVAEAADRIDIERATKARGRAEEHISGSSDNTDYTRAQDAIQRADTRLSVVGKK
jgi:F-type H+-transporting ATPase subunit epsilon